MKKIDLKLLAVVAIGVCCAWATKRPAWMSSRDFHHYAFYQMSPDRTRYYVSKDLTAAGWIAGDQYDCVSPTVICTLIANPVALQTDWNGMWFAAVNVPHSGIDSSGTFMPF